MHDSLTVFPPPFFPPSTISLNPPFQLSPQIDNVSLTFLPSFLPPFLSTPSILIWLNAEQRLVDSILYPTPFLKSGGNEESVGCEQRDGTKSVGRHDVIVSDI